MLHIKTVALSRTVEHCCRISRLAYVVAHTVVLCTCSLQSDYLPTLQCFSAALTVIMNMIKFSPAAAVL